MTSSRTKLFFLIVIIASGAFVAGYFIPRATSPSPSALPVNTVVSSDYPFINRAIIANIGKHFIINFKPLKEELQNIQKKYPQKTYIYLSYLNNGSWVGLGEREEFVAASTIKVPIAMSLLKAVEEGKLKLSEMHTIEKVDINPGFGDLYEVGEGKDFSIEELLKIMLEQSDNTAMNALISVFKNIGIEDPLGDVYGFLGWEFTQAIPELGETPDYSDINLKTLSNLFIALYDAKYITTEHSNKILEYLANSPFDDKIESGVPKGIVVSHKIGTASLDKTFSDCGIVYAPNRNYLLCLGSNGATEKVASEFMNEISKAVYQYVINN